jgi:hypothetical protein
MPNHKLHQIINDSNKSIIAMGFDFDKLGTQRLTLESHNLVLVFCQPLINIILALAGYDVGCGRVDRAGANVIKLFMAVIY